MNPENPGPRPTLSINSAIRSVNFRCLSDGPSNSPLVLEGWPSQQGWEGPPLSQSQASPPSLLPRGTCPSKADGQAALSRVRTPKPAKLPVTYLGSSVTSSPFLGNVETPFVSESLPRHVPSGSNHVIPATWEDPTFSKNQLHFIPKTPSQALAFLLSIMTCFHR